MCKFFQVAKWEAFFYGALLHKKNASHFATSKNLHITKRKNCGIKTAKKIQEQADYRLFFFCIYISYYFPLKKNHNILYLEYVKLQ